MLSGFLYPYTLPSVTISVSAQNTINLRDLPKQQFGLFCHLAKIVYGINFTPTTTALPTTVQHNNVFTSADMWDGSFQRFLGGFNHLRARERLSCGRVRVSDPDTSTASAAARYYRRTWHAGPAHFKGYPSDFVIPCAMLETGYINTRQGALVDYAADCTAVSGTVRPTAFMMLLSEFRIPPAYQFINQTIGASDVNISGRALYESITLLNSASFDAITSGDFGNIRLDLGGGEIVPNIKGGDLLGGYQDDFATGDIGGFTGDPEGTADNHDKVVNRASATALAAGAADLQVVLWSPPDSRITKLQYAESVCRLRWDGTQSTAVALIGRILPQPAPVIAAAIAKTLGKLNMKATKYSPKSLSKKGYGGDKVEFFPWQVKV